jgi:DNA-binding NtrC family response regulator
LLKTQRDAEGLGMSDKVQVMVVDDDLAMCGFLRTFLGDRGYATFTVTNGDDALRRFHAERPSAVLLDLALPGGIDGLAALAVLRKTDKAVPVIVISGQNRTPTVVKAMKLGATDFVCKPLDTNHLEEVLGGAIKQQRTSQELAALREQLRVQSPYTLLLGASRGMAEVRDLIDRVSDADVTVMIRGESGTGKDLVARAVCERSLRKDKPLVKVNCAALPRELLESELFGFERGAFTGAVQHKPGRFEFANHGTIFLDEIGDMSPALQAKLLQVLQDGEFSRLGGKADVRVDVRVISATNRDLEKAVAEGQFREDLYFRLNVVTIHLPPLRERREDIPWLTDQFLKKYSVQFNKSLVGISSDLARRLMRHHWPGNVRELENLIKRLVVLGREDSIFGELHTTDHPQPLHPRSAPGLRAESGTESQTAFASPADTQGSVSLRDIARSAARETERQLILDMLMRTRWNRKEAAEILGISYKALLYKIKESGLDKAS